MSTNRIPGPVGIATDFSQVDKGTLSIAPSPPPAPLSQTTRPSSRAMTIALARLTTVTTNFAGRHIRDTQLRKRYLDECERCTQALTSLFRQKQVDGERVQDIAKRSGSEIVDMQGLIGADSVPLFHNLTVKIRRSGGAEMQKLLDVGFTQQSDAKKQASCLELIGALAPDNLELNGPNGPYRIERWLRFMTASLVWMLEAARMSEALSWQPKIIQATSAYHPVERPSTPRPSPARRARPAAPPPVKQEPVTQFDQDQQAATLESAAKDGTPFCEECEKARNSRQTQAQGAA